jgi:hypothetical protein
MSKYVPSIKPEPRDIDFAKRLMWDSWHDFVRCRREYGAESQEASIALKAYQAEYDHWRTLIEASQ